MAMALDGVRVIDLSRTPPGQYASMLLGDHGAEVLMVEPPPGAVPRFDAQEREGGADPARDLAANPFRRNKRALALNLRDEDGRALFLRLAERADVVIDGFRPGVTARLGVDYGALSRVNPRIVTCTVSGYGRTGPYAQMAGHDVNYIAIGGALGSIGDDRGKPVLPLNVVADFAAGGLMAAFAIMLALRAREGSGRGQDIDLAMSDGVTSLMAMHAWRMYGQDAGPPRRGDHVLAGQRCCYGVYECADGEWIAVGAIEPYFFEALCGALGFPEFVPHQHDAERQPEMKAAFAAAFRAKTRAEWFAELGEADACLTPVLGLDEAMDDPHARARGMAIEVGDEARAGPVTQVGVAPKLLATPGSVRRPPAAPGEHTGEVLAELGLGAARVAALRARGAVA